MRSATLVPQVEEWLSEQINSLDMISHHQSIGHVKGHAIYTKSCSIELTWAQYFAPSSGSISQSPMGTSAMHACLAWPNVMVSNIIVHIDYQIASI